jgi:hypothetical protein
MRVGSQGTDVRRSAAGHPLARRGLLMFVAAGLVGGAAILLPELSVRDANAQFFWNWGDRSAPAERVPRPRRPVGPPPQQRGGGWFPAPWGWGGPGRQADRPSEPEPQRPGTPRPSQRAESNDRAPAPKRPASETAKRALVLGDSMADWLGYGLEETFAESDTDPGEWAVTRKHRTGSTLIRGTPRDVDWVQAAKETLAAEQAAVVLMMIGLGDRQPIREEAAAQDGANEQTDARPGTRRTTRVVTHEFRSERWVELYTERIDSIIAALKAKGVPVFWVGLPPINGPRARSDLAFLNEIFKARAEKAGIVYVDVWDGFIEESGVFSSFGPDVMGQRRRLRSADGIHFTDAGAVKLAHFVDREIKRILSRSIPVALPAPQEVPDAAPSGPAPRPVVGPVISLTGDTAGGGRLLGSEGRDAQVVDPVVRKVLVIGEPPPRQAGRADNFVWPPPHAAAEQEVAPQAAVPAPERHPDTTGTSDERSLARKATHPEQIVRGQR